MQPTHLILLQMPLPAVGTEPLDYKVYTFHLIALWQVYGRYLQVVHTECALALHTEKVGDRKSVV